MKEEKERERDKKKMWCHRRRKRRWAIEGKRGREGWQG